METLRLRPCKKSDRKYVVQWLTDERMMRMWCRDRFTFPLTEEQLDEYYEGLEKDACSWGFTALNESGIPAGSFLMSRVDYEAGSVHLGYIVVDPEQRGKGVGHKMVSLAVRYGTEILGMKRITLNVFELNPGAKRCYEKAGFVVERRGKDDFSFENEVWEYSVMVYTVTK
jgi:RimJ/RimL family protein N-acetyltransferase